MEGYSRIPMGRTGKIIRRSIFTFLQNYQHFTITAAVLAFPYAASVLLLQALIPSSSILLIIHTRLQVLFGAAGFPPSSELFSIMNHKISQTIASSVLCFPFSVSFLLLSKASVIQAFRNHKHVQEIPFSSFICPYFPLLLTQLWNSFIILAANATCFCLLFFAFNFIDAAGFSDPRSILFLSAVGAVLYSIILANTIITCNLGLILSGTERRGGYMAILKACVLIRGKTATALSLALPITTALALVEALFHYRVVRSYYDAKSPFSCVALEGMFIAYLYATLVVLDTVVGCSFLKSCTTALEVDQECEFSCQTIDIEGRQSCGFRSSKSPEQFLP